MTARQPRYEWDGTTLRVETVTDGPWVCDCPDYDLEPQPNWLGECAVCRRPVYDTNGTRITRRQGAHE